MAVMNGFSKEEMGIDTSVGYPRAYAKLCKDKSGVTPYNNGPPFTFTPFNLHSNEVSRAKELDEMFPIIHQDEKPTSRTRIFVGVLWKQLNHLGNAGFDPAMFRVDPYGNVLYFHANSASPLAWAIDHWFPSSRGGLTVPSNLRILQWQVCKRKHNQLEFLVPWWDLQLGISINQFLSIFAAVNSDFRHRAFRWLFSAGENEELNDQQTVDSHKFPQAYMKSKEQLGLAPAAIVRSRKESADASSTTLRTLDFNRQPRPSTPIIAASRKFRDSGSKENDMPDMVTNPYQAIVMARDSLKQREGTNKMKAEIHRLDDEVNEYKLKNEEEKLTIQELELALIKSRRRAEKCRKLAEAQSAHKAVLEKMISNAMHQSVVYREQVRLNQAATNSLMARLEAQMAISNSAEKELYKKFKQRDELEKQVRPQYEQARKRSRFEDDAFLEEKEDRTLIYLPKIRTQKHLHKELRVFLEEEQKLSEEALSMIEEEKPEENTGNLGIEHAMRFSFAEDIKVEEDEETRNKRGKGNVEKWLQMMLEDKKGKDGNIGSSKSDEIIKLLNEKYPQKEINELRLPNSSPKTQETRSVSTPRRSVSIKDEPRTPRSVSTPRRSVSCEGEVSGKEGEARKSIGARSLRHCPSSPSMIMSMRKGVDCLRRKPLVIDDGDECQDEDQPVGHNFLKSSIKSIKKVVKI